MGKTVFKWIVAFVILLGLFIIPNPNANVVFAANEDTGKVSRDGLLVKYRYPDAEFYRTLKEVEILRDVESVEVIAPQVELLTMNEGTDLESFKAQLENDPAVEFVEPNYQRQLYGAVNDSYFSSQWWVPHVKAESLWMHASSQKQKAVVAVIDSGVDMNHEDLKGRIEPGGYDFYFDRTMMTDPNGHGTKVSGVIAAESGNGRGISGIVGPYDVSILPLKVSHTGNVYLSDLLKAIDYAVMKKVDVINISLGGPEYSALENAAIQRAIQADIVVVSAAGNEALTGNGLSYPASYDNVISVGAVNERNERSAFSNYNSFVDLVAPGERVFTTYPSDSYNYVAGTSFSSPIVAGTVAMMKAVDPGLTPREIESVLKNTAKDLGAPGHDPYYGAGVLDIGKLVTQLDSLKHPENPIAVTGVKLNTQELYIDMRESLQSYDRSGEQLQRLEITREKAAIVYEREPNNNYSSANRISTGDSVVGSITDRYYDLDYYKFTIDSDGTFSLLGGWFGSAYIDHRDNRYLAIGLYDGQQQIIDFASLQSISSGESWNYLSKELKRGTYYLVAFQSSPYQYLFTNEEYMMTTLFTPDKAPEIPPTILFDQAFMKKGEVKSFVSGTHSESIFATSNPGVATIDRNGKIRAVGHGTTIISHTIGTEVKQSIVKVTDDLVNPTAALFEEVLPENAEDKSVSWSSSNNEVATVDKYGIITAKENGQTVITVTTADGNYKDSATVYVEGGSQPEFISDFPDMNVSNSKVFTVTFNQELDPKKDYSRDILIARQADGTEPITSFDAKVDVATPSKLLITPTSEWGPGEHYLTITTGVRNNNNKALNKDIRMKFIVSEKAENVNELKEYKKLRGTLH